MNIRFILWKNLSLSHVDYNAVILYDSNYSTGCMFFFFQKNSMKHDFSDLAANVFGRMKIVNRIYDATICTI